ncbi:MAG: ribbon-helix-helix protein, CopG family [Candidatus Lokiarchaeota archaeon]|nr:ribbon-helix-helix protein, CopG family [Candidatus Lokiarchaeota archaeon]
MSKNDAPKKLTKVITIRIDEELNDQLDKMHKRMGISKTSLIKNYLELSKYLIKQKSALQSLNDRDLVVVKRSFLRNLIERLEESEQLNFGDKLGVLINDIARIYGKQEDIRYKVDFCDKLGFFSSILDDDNNLLVVKKLGPKKFVEAFLWRLFEQKELNPDYIEEEMKGNKSLRQKYKNQIKALDISSSHYSYEFAKIPENNND